MAQKDDDDIFAALRDAVAVFVKPEVKPSMLSPALTYGEGRFVFDGGRVNGEKTPEDYDMVSGDKIDFFPDLMGA
jgi:small ubiquitin-related modifier